VIDQDLSSGSDWARKGGDAMEIRNPQIADSTKNQGNHDKARKAESAPIASAPTRRDT
jgi:hypothetical protein